MHGGHMLGARRPNDMCKSPGAQRASLPRQRRHGVAVLASRSRRSRPTPGGCRGLWQPTCQGSVPPGVRFSFLNPPCFCSQGVWRGVLPRRRCPVLVLRWPWLACYGLLADHAWTCVCLCVECIQAALLDKMRGLVSKVVDKKPQLLHKFFVASAVKSLDDHKVGSFPAVCYASLHLPRVQSQRLQL